jgi:RNA polymerase sigma-70 factor (ECF subfamily)
VSTANETSQREIFAELYEEYLPRVFRYVRYRVNEQALAEDLTSTTFEKALVNFARYSADKAAFSTWIFTIARNVIIDHFRARGRKPQVSLEEREIDVASPEPQPEEAVERHEEKLRVRRMVAGLSPEEQEIIALKFGSGLNNRQIAKALGMSESNVGTKLYRAVRKLRDSFPEKDNG